MLKILFKMSNFFYIYWDWSNRFLFISSWHLIILITSRDRKHITWFWRNSASVSSFATLRNAIQICFLLRLFVMIRFRDHAWSFHRHFDEWRMSILDYRVTHVCSRFVERRLWWNVIKIDETFHQTHDERLIKFDESDSSNLMNESVISSSRTNASSHQTFEKKDSFFTFWWAIFCSDIWCEELSFAKSSFCAKIDVWLLWWVSVFNEN